MKTTSSLLLCWLPLLLFAWAIESPVAAQPGKSGPPPPLKGVIRRKVRCLSLLFPSCYNQWHFCPVECAKTCFLDCALCKPVCSCNTPGAVCQDPRFVGGDGVTFFFHGRKNEDFCLVSDPNLHINGHFIGKRSQKLTRDFTWVQSIGIMFDDHQLLVGAKRTSTWDDNEEHLYISFNGTPLSLDGPNWNYRNSSLVITRTSSTNAVAIEVQDNFRITAAVVPIGAEESRIHGYNITNDDCFAHLELGFKFFSLSDQVDGVLGQTYRSNYVSKIKVSANMPVMGNIPKYSTSGIFASDCTVSRFARANGTPLTGSGKVF
ncbi:root cap [Artemisia annua]|uniref:Root cap n=1 Tax=Artemisia annua TaxID=35608 RepID=A0A2U1KQM0_ARTAN|nr:root cap [Artemisia annua]